MTTPYAVVPIVKPLVDVKGITELYFTVTLIDTVLPGLLFGFQVVVTVVPLEGAPHSNGVIIF